MRNGVLPGVLRGMFGDRILRPWFQSGRSCTVPGLWLAPVRAVCLSPSMTAAQMTSPE